MKYLKRAMMLSVAGSVIGYPAVAQVQTESSKSESVIGEIVVTAQKRDQSIQKVPIAINAVTGAAIKERRIQQAVDLASSVTNLSSKNAVGDAAPVFTLRGIGLNDFATNGTQPVGVYLDEVYLVSNAELGFQLMDMDRVEVLKGPQGTLYGRNTTAGAISFITKKPEKSFSAETNITGGNYGFLSADGYVNIPITATLSARVSASTERQFDGYFTNLLTGQSLGQVRRAAWRGQLLWEPDTDTSVLLNYHGGTDHSDNWYYKYIADASGTPEGVALQSLATQAGPDIFAGQHAVQSHPYIDNFSSGTTLGISHHFDTFTLKSISSAEFLDYTHTEEFGSLPVPAGWNSYSGKIQQYSQEMRLTSNTGGAFKWIVGLFGSLDKLNENDLYDNRAAPIFLNYVFNEKYTQKTTSLAAFANADVELLPHLGATLGLRYTDETKRYIGGTYIVASNPATAYDTCPCTTDTRLHYGVPTGKLSLNYTLPIGLAYASYSRSYKAGGVTGFIVTDPGGKAPYKPEFINAGEVGLKSDWLDHRLRVNLAAFYYDYHDLQAFGVINNEFRIFNIGKSRVYGGELELTAVPLQNLRLDYGMGLLATKVLKSDVGGVPVGNRLGNAPKLEINFTPAYTLSLTENYNLKLAVEVNYRAGVFYYVQNDPRQYQSAYTLLAPRVTLESTDKGWSATAWVKNATNKRYYSEIFNDGNYVIGFPAAPRTYGISISHKWK